MVGRSRVDGQGANALVHATIHAAASRLGDVDHTPPLRGSVIVLIDRGQGGIGLRRVETRRGVICASGGGSGRLVVTEGRPVWHDVIAVGRWLRGGGEKVERGIVVVLVMDLVEVIGSAIGRS